MINEGHWVILDNFQDLYKSGVNDCTTFKRDGKRPWANPAERNKELSFVKVELELKRQGDRLRSRKENRIEKKQNFKQILIKAIMVRPSDLWNEC